MTFHDDVVKRTTLAKLREFLLYGCTQEEINSDSYEERLDKAYNDYLLVLKKYEDDYEESELYSAMNALLTENQHIYMEVGLQAGFRLLNDIFTSS